MGNKEVTLFLEIVNARHGPEANLGEQWPVPGPHDHLADPGSLLGYLDFEGVTHPPGSPGDADLQSLRELADAGRSVVDEEPPRSRARIERVLAGFTYRLAPDGELLPAATGWAGFAAEAARGLVELAPLRDRLQRCANPACSWLFLDESRNHSRQWCSMESCGSRAKMTRYRRRKREGEAEVPRRGGTA